MQVFECRKNLPVCKVSLKPKDSKKPSFLFLQFLKIFLINRLILCIFLSTMLLSMQTFWSEISGYCVHMLSTRCFYYLHNVVDYVMISKDIGSPDLLIFFINFLKKQNKYIYPLTLNSWCYGSFVKIPLTFNP